MRQRRHGDADTRRRRAALPVDRPAGDAGDRVGRGLVFAPCFNLGTAGVAEADAGVASATIHVAQQIGGSIGTAPLNTIATTVAARYVMTHAARLPTPGVEVHAAVHSYAVAFGVAAVAFGVAALAVTALLNPAGSLVSRTRTS